MRGGLKFYRWTEVIHIINLEGTTNKTNISRNLCITWSSLAPIIFDLIKRGLVLEKQKGRKKFLSLTTKGKLIANSINIIFKNID